MRLGPKLMKDDDDEDEGFPDKIFKRRINFDKMFGETGNVYTCK